MRISLVLCVLVLTACAGGNVDDYEVRVLRGSDDGLPWSEDGYESLAIRTDFTDDAAWDEVRTAITAPIGDFRAYLAIVDDPRYDGLTVEQLLDLAAQAPNHSFAFLIDHRTVTDPEHPVLVVELSERSGRTFRLVPPAMWEVQNNLSIANSDWEDFADFTDANGVYQGLPEFRDLRPR